MFSTKGRYALRIMIELAERGGDDFIPLKVISEDQEISKKYLEIIAKELVKGKLLVGASGKHGGYKLTRSPEEYTVGEIIELMEGPIVPVMCLAPGAEECPRYKVCKTLPMWKEFYQIEHDFFYGKTLADLVNSK
ncbi:MAG: Rrf2 family transcriptional regulator [Butyrivibrio sp.]|nr:Rrf2 family transcriptional regulator [Butyrivibrio sp.]